MRMELIGRCSRVGGGKIVTAASLLVLSVILCSCASSGGGGYIKKDFVAEARDAIVGLDVAMGDWQGSWKLDDESDSGPLVAQVIALGGGKYRANLMEQFDSNSPVERIGVLEGQAESEVVNFTGRAHHSGMDFDVKAKIEGGKLTGTFNGQDSAGAFSLERVFRVSSTMGAKPPKGAAALFLGREKDLDNWKRANAKEGEDDTIKWELVDGAMRVNRSGSIETRKTFTNVALHVEFRSPFMPDKRGQGRGNSGVYLQGKYEVQVLDSYGLEGKDNECGGIYKVRAPLVNMCAPPGQWQTYDITFRAPRFDSEGNLANQATMTVLHNGVLIQDQTPVGGTTTAGKGGDPAKPAGIYLQDHGNPVEYRNIWLVEQ